MENAAMENAAMRIRRKKEGNLTATLTREVLSRQGCMVYPLMGRREAPPGWPDRLLVHWKWRGLVEFKTKKRQCEVSQVQVILDLANRRMNVAVCRLFDDRTFQLEEPGGEALHEPKPWIELLDTLVEYADLYEFSR